MRHQCSTEISIENALIIVIFVYLFFFFLNRTFKKVIGLYTGKSMWPLFFFFPFHQHPFNCLTEIVTLQLTPLRREKREEKKKKKRKASSRAATIVS